MIYKHFFSTFASPFTLRKYAKKKTAAQISHTLDPHPPVWQSQVSSRSLLWSWTNCLICAKSAQTDFSIAHTRAAKKHENYYDWVVFAARSSKVIFAPSSTLSRRVKRRKGLTWNVEWFMWIIGFPSHFRESIDVDSNFQFDIEIIWLMLSAL